MNLLETSTIPTEEILTERGIDNGLSKIIIEIYNKMYRTLHDL